jgi:hypothetical protein
MKVYNHKDAFVHLNYILKNQVEDVFMAVFDETVVHYGSDGGFNIDEAISLKIPTYNIHKRGGAMVTSPGDVVYCFLLKENHPTLNEDLRKFLSNKLSKRNIHVELVKNDLLINGKKCFGFMQNEIGDCYFIGGHISIDCNLDLIKKLCTKPMEKIPGGLGEYNITTDEVIDWLNEF